VADVFLSYARDDEALARRVATALQAAGLDVWWDADLPAHRAYSEIIEHNLEEARAVVVLWSKTAAKSQWVRAEADFARNAGKLVQAQVDGALPPMPFNQIQCADLKGWRGSYSHRGWAKLKSSVEALVSGEDSPASAPSRQGLWDRIQPYRWWIAAALVLLVAATGLLLTYGRPAEEGKPVLAVLPFKSLDSRDESLVAGMWEDTRRAIGRNPQLIVLGPNTSQELAKKDSSAAKRAADYLLQASVRTVGDRIRVSTDLVRTSDGAQLWSQNFDRKLDDVFALQSDIAREIEGRIRGRLAESGGVKPEHIATSGDVYALYSDARAKIRKRDVQLYHAARDELEQVVKMDPNFAPGWATLSVVNSMTPMSQSDRDALRHAEQFARKAIELAPNLASGHAALAIALNFDGPVARAAIERAVQLDPNDYEAMLWLGNTNSRDGRKRKALEAYARAAEIEPLFFPAVLNELGVLQDLGDKAGIQALIDKEKSLGAQHLVTAIQMELAAERGDLAEAANTGLDYLKTGRTEGRTAISATLSGILLGLGYTDEAYIVSPNVPEFAPYLWRNDPKGLDMLEALRMPPREFFAFGPLPANAGKVYVLSGRGKTLADMYLSLGVSPQEFAKLSGDPGFLYAAPIVAVALLQNGHGDEAKSLLATTEGAAKERLTSDRSPASSALLARVYAAQGRNEEALPLLANAVNRNWWPTPPSLHVDVALDPAFAGLKGDPRFERLRRQILGTIKRERAQVRISELN
jgi:TolB-like protein